MSKMYPIWNDVQACIYKSSKSYGVRNEGIVNIKVGSSAVWSFDFVKHRTTRRMLTKEFVLCWYLVVVCKLFLTYLIRK